MMMVRHVEFCVVGLTIVNTTTIPGGFLHLWAGGLSKSPWFLLSLFTGSLWPVIWGRYVQSVMLPLVEVPSVHSLSLVFSAN